MLHKNRRELMDATYELTKSASKWKLVLKMEIGCHKLETGKKGYSTYGWLVH
ncbi:MAG: hypothetical protein ABJN61_07645 [Flavobacteriaceae bacterium]